MPLSAQAFEVIARGNRLTIKVNDVTTVDSFEDSSFQRGHFALQQGSEETIVSFQKIEIKELPASKNIITLKNTFGMEFVLVPKGESWLGGGKGKPGDKEVEIAADFYLGKYEVTQAEWSAMMMMNLSGYEGARRPVDGPTWREAQEFVRRLSMKTGKQYRLPSEAEWEYAARGGTATEFLAGNIPTGLDQYAWFSQNANKETHPVGEKQANAFGLHDVFGNVYEWTQDCYQDSYAGAPRNGSVRQRANCQTRVVRGGGWSDRPRYLRSAIRYGDPPDYRGNYVGFRVARD